MIFEKTSFDPVEKIWSGPVKTSAFPTDSSIGVILEQVMLQHKDKPCQIFEPTGETWSFGKLHKTAIKIARTLLRKNISQDDIIGICASNTLYVPALAVASFLIGTPISTLDPSFDKEGILHIYGITRPKILFCDRDIEEKVRSTLKDINLDCDVYIIDECAGKGTIEEFLVECSNCDYFR